MSDRPVKSAFVIDEDYYKALSEYQAKEPDQANKRVEEIVRLLYMCQEQNVSLTAEIEDKDDNIAELWVALKDSSALLSRCDCQGSQLLEQQLEENKKAEEYKSYDV